MGPTQFFVITLVERKDKNLHKKIIKYNHDYETGWSGGGGDLSGHSLEEMSPRRVGYEGFHHGAASSWAVSHPPEKELSKERSAAPPPCAWSRALLSRDDLDEEN